MHHTMTWHIAVQITHPDGRNTEADAILRTDTGLEMRHAGFAQRRRDDRDVPEIGDALAASRALEGLAHQLFALSTVDHAWTTEPEELQLSADTEWAGLD